jgi:putative hydrolase of HD superfamily
LPDKNRLQQQMTFILEADKLKQILRQTPITEKTRQENSAEHSWHVALMGILLLEYAKGPHIDVLQIVKMLLIHDLVEIDAGDTFCYDDQARQDQHHRELKAAKRLFNLLPADQAALMQKLWGEYETCHTLNAQYANALDRLQPILLNYCTDGEAWQRHNVKRHQVIARNRWIKEGAPRLWVYVNGLINDAVQRGFLSEA